ncbi:MAG: tetratricopeptide repeat protein [Hyphomicrobiaceae bacterium]
MRPFTIQLSLLIGRQDFDGAIAYLRAHLKGDSSDISSLEMIAHCQLWAGRTDEAEAACYSALVFDPNAFDMHALLAQHLAKKGEHKRAAIHASKGLEFYPEPLPKMPRFMISAIRGLSRIFSSLRGLDPDEALHRVETERAEWLGWAKQYLNWYDSGHGATLSPTEH